MPENEAGTAADCRISQRKIWQIRL